MQRPLWWIKWTRYEYWPVWFFFLPPTLLFWPILAIRARALLYFTAANPGIPLGGFFGEKKFDIIKSIPAQYLPQTLLISHSQLHNAPQLIAEQYFKYPLIVKPNVGERGNDVAKIENEAQLVKQLKRYTGDVIVQEFITHPEEYGVMFYKLPDGSKSGITSIVKKGFLTATGDGKSTLLELLLKNDRARFQLPSLAQKPTINLNEVLPEGEKRLVEPIGNHCKGTAFINENKLITNELIAEFEKIAAAMPGFYFGRFDIKAPSDETLKKGQGITVMEVNGTTSEPGHIYDMQTMNLWKAYRDIYQNMSTICTIAIMNHRQFGVPYSSKKEFLSTLYGHFFKNRR